jgi:outer membrane protein assembly factor BamB
MGPISSSPAVAAVLNGSASGEYVFIGSEDGYLYAFNALGCGGNLMCGPVWQSSNLGNITNSSPAVAVEVINGVQESVVYITSGFGINGTGGGIFALNAATGAQIWKTGDFTSQFSSPNVVDGVVYVLAGDHYVDAIDATMGTVLWQGPVANNYPSPAVANGEVYVGERFTLKAFDANGCNNPVCSPLWTGQAGGTYLNESPAVANAVVNGNQNPVVYVGSYNGYLYAFDANGIINCTNNVCQPLWVGAGAGEVSSPAVAPPTGTATNGVVYVGGGGNNLSAFDANGVKNCTIVNGTQTCQPLWVGTTNGTIYSSPAVANGVVYVESSDGYLYAFVAGGCGKSVCSPLSTFYIHDNGMGNSSPAVSGGLVYIGSSDGYLYVIGPPPACAYSPPYC